MNVTRTESKRVLAAAAQEEYKRLVADQERELGQQEIESKLSGNVRNLPSVPKELDVHLNHCRECRKLYRLQQELKANQEVTLEQTRAWVTDCDSCDDFYRHRGSPTERKRLEAILPIDAVRATSKTGRAAIQRRSANAKMRETISSLPTPPTTRRLYASSASPEATIEHYRNTRPPRISPVSSPFRSGLGQWATSWWK